MDDQKKILEMLAQGRINVDQAERLLNALKEGKEEKKKVIPQYLHVNVDPKTDGGDRVKVRVPFRLVRAGMKLATLIPSDIHGKLNDELKEKGVKIDLSQVNAENIDEFIQSLSDLKVDVNNESEQVKIYCE